MVFPCTTSLGLVQNEENDLNSFELFWAIATKLTKGNYKKRKGEDRMCGRCLYYYLFVWWWLGDRWFKIWQIKDKWMQVVKLGGLYIAKRSKGWCLKIRLNFLIIERSAWTWDFENPFWERIFNLIKTLQWHHLCSLQVGKHSHPPSHNSQNFKGQL